MNKTLNFIALMTISGAGQTATLVAGQAYDINILADGVSCFTLGDCTAGGPYTTYFFDNDNDAAASSDSTDPDFGSAIAGDGLAGNINITTTSDGAGGVDFTVNSFNMDTYHGTFGGLFATMVRDPSTMSGSVDVDGNITLNTTGRTGMFEYFDDTFDEVSYSATHTSGNQINAVASLTGTTLSLDGSAVIITAGETPYGAVPYGWGIFGDTPYTEVFSLQFVGGDIVPSAVPVPAAVWLFGSGFIGLIGFARHKTT